LSILYLRRSLRLNPGARLLHFAPEKCLERYFSERKDVDYLSVDLQPGKAMQVEDMTALSFPDDTFDAIYCSHVLEHVPDDRQGIREMFRVLKPGGCALLMVPLRKSPTTHEDWSIDTVEGRRLAVGQADHVRAYGQDFPERLREAGFSVEIVKPHDELTEEERLRYVVTPDTIFIARPPAQMSTTAR
jgi:SAM-dependent methyltransferase